VTRLSRIFLLSLALLAVGRLGVEVYDWAAHRQERERIRGLRTRLLDAGVEVVRSHAHEDSLAAALREADEALEREHRLLEESKVRALRGGAPPALYAAYREALDRYNRQVAVRNARARARWGAQVRKQEAQTRYDALADSIRGMARALGDPYYSVPLPAEAASERGAQKLDP